MSQTAIDLPDPLDHASESASNTDDLLSQMAGNDIDRLLAEADDGHPSRPKATHQKTVKPHTSEANEAAAEAAIREEPPVADQLGALFGEIEKRPATEAVESTSAIETRAERQAMLEAAGFDTTGEDASENDARADAVDSVDPAAYEREALLTAAGFDTSANSPQVNFMAEDDAENFEDSEYIPPLPIFLKPLEWINAPVSALPPGMRDFMGKFAIVTLVNALAALGYVLISRKH